VYVHATWTNEMNSADANEINALGTNEMNVLNVGKVNALSHLWVLSYMSSISNLILPLN